MDSITDSTAVSLPNQTNGTIHHNDHINHDDPVNTPRSKKGFGLKKWRRIPRKINHLSPNEIQTPDNDRDKERDSDSDTVRMLKRGSSNIIPAENPLPSINDSATATFNAGIDSNCSEDSHRGSSRSSTAASAPKHLHHHKNNRGKNSNPRLVMNSKSQSDPTKKAKDGGELDKENSPILSLESDSRSCNSVFGTQNVGGCSSEQQSAQEHRPAESSDRLSSSVKQGKSKDDDDHVNGDDDDPLVGSILLLQSAQLALQAEVQKFGEIGKGIYSLYDDSDKTNGVAVDAVVYMANGSTCNGCNDNDNLNNTIQSLERQLNEAECSLKEKELWICKLETTLKSMESPQDHVKSTMEQQYKTCVEMEAELQVLFRKKLEAEVLSVVMTRSIKDSSVLVEEHSLLAKEELESPRMVDLKAKDGDTSKSDTLVTGEEIREMHRGVKKLGKCFFIQLLLLLVVVTLFVFQLAPKPEVVVPT